MICITESRALSWSTSCGLPLRSKLSLGSFISTGKSPGASESLLLKSPVGPDISSGEGFSSSLTLSSRPVLAQSFQNRKGGTLTYDGDFEGEVVHAILIAQFLCTRRLEPGIQEIEGNCQATKSSGRCSWPSTLSCAGGVSCVEEVRDTFR